MFIPAKNLFFLSPLIFASVFCPTPVYAQINAFDPVASNSIVVNAAEFPSSLPGFINYKGWKTNPQVVHNKEARNVRTTPVRFLILHESAGPDHGDGFNLPYTSHFSVLKNRNILQFNDIAEIQWHAGIFNNEGLGIEFVNRSWITGFHIPAREAEMTATQRNVFGEDKGHLWTFWGEGYNIYKLPPVDQLEKLDSLVKRLTRKLDPGFPSINNQWLQLVSYDDISSFFEFTNTAEIPQSAARKAAKNYFIFTSAYNYMVPSRFESFESGIISHSSISSIVKGYVDENAHPDGSFQALYCWLRTRFDKQQAYEKAKDLMKNHMVRARTVESLKWLEKGEERSGKRLVFLLHVGNL